MEWLAWVLFESTLALALLVGVLNFGLLVHWRRSGRPRALLTGLTLAVLLFVLQSLVVTRREHAKAILAGIERDVIAARVDTLSGALVDGFKVDGIPRDEFLELVQTALQNTSATWVQRIALDIIDSTSDSFTVHAAYFADVSTGAYSGRITSSWSITFTVTPAGWRIESISPRRIGGAKYTTWPALWRLTGQ